MVLQNLTLKVLSKNAPDFESRLAIIKTTFYQQKLNEQLKSKTNPNFSWQPNWDKPIAQIINDSVSYVFYPLVPQMIKNDKIINTEEIGSKSYLVVKNEKDFFKGIFRQPAIAEPKQLLLTNFTGNLLLSNLSKKELFVVDYVNEKLSKKPLQIKKKLETVGASHHIPKPFAIPKSIALLYLMAIAMVVILPYINGNV